MLLRGIVGTAVWSALVLLKNLAYREKCILAMSAKDEEGVKSVRGESDVYGGVLNGWSTIRSSGSVSRTMHNAWQLRFLPLSEYHPLIRKQLIRHELKVHIKSFAVAT
jgi:hypothetical protein